VLAISAVLVPLAGKTAAAVAVLVAAQYLAGLGLTVYRINQLGLRQPVTPRHLLGRVTSARTFLIFCVAPLGAALGGYLGTTVGIQPALVVAAAVMCLQPLGLSPRRSATYALPERQSSSDPRAISRRGPAPSWPTGSRVGRSCRIIERPLD
jgi:hypothetical protein